MPPLLHSRWSAQVESAHRRARLPSIRSVGWVPRPVSRRSMTEHHRYRELAIRLSTIAPERRRKLARTLQLSAQRRSSQPGAMCLDIADTAMTPPGERTTRRQEWNCPQRSPVGLRIRTPPAFCSLGRPMPVCIRAWAPAREPAREAALLSPQATRRAEFARPMPQSPAAHLQVGVHE